MVAISKGPPVDEMYRYDYVEIAKTEQIKTWIPASLKNSLFQFKTTHRKWSKPTSCWSPMALREVSLNFEAFSIHPFIYWASIGTIRLTFYWQFIFVYLGLVGEVVKRFESKGYKLCALKQMRPGRELLEEHYGDLKTKVRHGGMRREGDSDGERGSTQTRVVSPTTRGRWVGDKHSMLPFLPISSIIPFIHSYIHSSI